MNVFKRLIMNVATHGLTSNKFYSITFLSACVGALIETIFVYTEEVLVAYIGMINLIAVCKRSPTPHPPTLAPSPSHSLNKHLSIQLPSYNYSVWIITS